MQDRYHRSVTANRAAAPWPVIDVGQLLRQCTLAAGQQQEAVVKVLANEGGWQDDGGFGSWAPIRGMCPVLRAPPHIAHTPHCDGAGMLPIMRPPTDSGCLYFLLGVQHFSTARAARGHRLSLFGGRRCHAEEDPASTAAREFVEETLGCVATAAPDAEWLARGGDSRCLLAQWVRVRHAAAAALRGEDYLLRLRLFYVRKGVPRFYDVFVVLIPWDPEAPRRFARVRRRLHAEAGDLYEAVRHMRGGVDSVTDKMGRVRPCFMEMGALTLWSRRQLECSLANNHGAVFDFMGQAIQCRPNLTHILKEVLHLLTHLMVPSTGGHKPWLPPTRRSSPSDDE